MIADYLNVERSALRRRVLEVPGVPARNRIAWLNRQFAAPVYDKTNPSDTCVWLEDHLLLGSSAPYQVAAPSTKRLFHVYQVSVRVPALLGTDSVLTLLAALETAFTSTPVLLDPPGDGQTGLRISKVDMTTLQEPSWFHVPVSITFKYDA